MSPRGDLTEAFGGVVKELSCQKQGDLSFTARWDTGSSPVQTLPAPVLVTSSTVSGGRLVRVQTGCPPVRSTVLSIWTVEIRGYSRFSTLTRQRFPFCFDLLKS